MHVWSYYLAVDLCLRAQQDNPLGKLCWFSAKAICEAHSEGKEQENKWCFLVLHVGNAHMNTNWPLRCMKARLPPKYSKWWWTKVKWIGLSHTHNTSHILTPKITEKLFLVLLHKAQLRVMCAAVRQRLKYVGKKHRRITAERHSAGVLSVTGLLQGCDRAAKNDNVIAGMTFCLKMWWQNDPMSL